MPAVSARTLITDALVDIGMAYEGQALSDNDATRGLRILNRDVIDMWNAIHPFAWASVFTQATWAANQATRTIGPSGTFALTTRPTEILSAVWIDTTPTPDNRIIIHIRDVQWWRHKIDQAATDSYMTDLYYAPTVPTGTLYAYPTPTVARTVELETRIVLAEITAANIDTTYDFAPGYQSAIVATLAELYSIQWSKPLTPSVVSRGQKARAAILGLNTRPPRIATDGLGTRQGDYFDTKTRQTS